MKTYYSHGKLLLTGEYAVLDGALALAIPTKLGQFLKCIPSPSKGIRWKSVRADGSIWYEDFFDYLPNELEHSGKHNVRETLIALLWHAKKINPDFLSASQGWEVVTLLEFPETWGLGSSSTLINNIAQWANVDAFQLLNLSFGGSGYDIAAAQNNTPILYQLTDNLPTIQRIILDWPFKDQLFFVYLNRKQDSKEGIKKYRQVTFSNKFVASISDLTIKIKEARSLSDFEHWLAVHENMMSQFIGLPKVKESHFPDYSGSIKSLGAWGGDFILCTGSAKEQDYFRLKGYTTILSFQEMIA